uniref:Uncharacterized protein n=1 Tax=viral metagenome TaxID=1070528 RepID=A0A6C0EDJ2_9ZZZZ
MNDRCTKLKDSLKGEILKNTENECIVRTKNMYEYPLKWTENIYKWDKKTDVVTQVETHYNRSICVIPSKHKLSESTSEICKMITE